MTAGTATPTRGASRHDPVTRAVHWLVTGCAVSAVGLAWAMIEAPRPGAARAGLLMLHGSLGSVIFVLTVFWIAWRQRHPAPPLRPAMSVAEAALARATQVAIFFLFLAMPVSGYVALAAAGRPLDLFGVVDIPPALAASGSLSQTAIALHLAGEFLVYAVLALHVSGALRHAFRRDGIIERMLPRPQRGVR